jgi:dTDP-4-amino-4,6-dideoxygalactose transaminase
VSRIPLIRPWITDEVKAKVLEVLDRGYLTEGPVTAEFERACRDHIGCRHAIAMCNCTVGLETALRAAGVAAGDEVIVPDYTYPATASVVDIVGATAVLVDVDPETMLADYAAIEAAVTPRTRAVMPVSLFGNPLDYDRLDAIKRRHGLVIVEDAACSIGARWCGRPVGGFADASVFSFHPRKFITTGEGGLVTTDRDDWAEWMVSYKHFGMVETASREGTVFGRIGTNYKLSNVLAAIGLVQMRHVEELLSERRRLAERYTALLADHPAVKPMRVTAGGECSWQSYCVVVRDRDRVMKALRAEGIEAQIGTYALHLHPAYRGNPRCRAAGDLVGSRAAFERCLVLPLYHGMTEAEQDRVVGRLLALSETTRQ